MINSQTTMKRISATSTAMVLVAVVGLSRGTRLGPKVTVEDGVTFHCVGHCDSPKAVVSGGGNVLMGGHMYPGVTVPSDLEAYQWFLAQAAGGDVLVLTADAPPCDIYNSFLLDNITNPDSPNRPNSVTTACFTARDGSASPTLGKLLGAASGLFLTGGDQSLYFKYFQKTAVAAALSSGHAVVGGSSAGLAVQGEFAFVALQGGIVSADALNAPMDSSVSLSREFLAVNQPWMRGVVTDTHFFQRDRMGRLVTFVARVAEAGWPRDDNQSNANPGVLGVGLSEHTAVVVDRSGVGKFVGVGPAYFVRSAGRVPTTCVQGRHLSWTGKGVDVWRWNSSDATTDSQWDFKSWDPSPARTGTQYALTVKDGVLESSQPGGSIY